MRDARRFWNSHPSFAGKVLTKFSARSCPGCSALAARNQLVFQQIISFADIDAELVGDGARTKQQIMRQFLGGAVCGFSYRHDTTPMGARLTSRR
jgi:hypothetical protein